MYTWHSHNAKYVHVPPSQYKTCRCTTVTIQNMYAYLCHNTKHVGVPLSQYKTCMRTSITIQNIYVYHCHNTKHVCLPLSQYKTCMRTAVTIQNMSANTRCCKNYCLLSGYWSSGKVRCGNIKFRSSYFSYLTWLDDRRDSVPSCIFEKWNSILV